MVYLFIYFFIFFLNETCFLKLVVSDLLSIKCKAHLSVTASLLGFYGSSVVGRLPGEFMANECLELIHLLCTRGNSDDGIGCPASVQPEDYKNPLVNACAVSVDGPNAGSFPSYPSSTVLQVGEVGPLFSS